MSVTDAVIRDRILATIAARGGDKTCCPSEIARQLAANDSWRDLMPRVRAVAAELTRNGVISAYQGGRAVDPGHALGPIRLGVAKR